MDHADAVAVWIGEAEPRENLRLLRFHLLGFLIIEMIVAAGMKNAVNEEMGKMIPEGLLLLLRLALEHCRTNHDVRRHDGFARVVEGKNVRCIVLPAVLVIELAPFVLKNEADGELPVVPSRAARIQRAMVERCGSSKSPAC